VTGLPPTHRLPSTARLVREGPVLDIGAAGAALRDLLDVSGYVGLDPVAAPSGTVMVAGRSEQLPFGDGTFGAVTCISVLQYVLDVETAVSEMHRVLRPGGQALLQVPNMAYARNVLKLATGRFPWSSVKDSWAEGTIRYFTWHDLHPLLLRTGFAVRLLTCTGRLSGIRSRWPAHLGPDLLIDLERGA